MKKLTALLLSLMLMTNAALAESTILSRIRVSALLSAVCDVMAAEELEYEKSEEYDCCYSAFALTTPSVLGAEIYMTVYASDEGIGIIGSYEKELSDDCQDEVIRLCNFLSCDLYLGKFYVDPDYDELCYEFFIPMDAMDIRDFDRALIAEYIWTAAGILDAYQEYFLMVVEGVESADNAFAIWRADME